MMNAALCFFASWLKNLYLSARPVSSIPFLDFLLIFLMSTLFEWKGMVGEIF